MSAGDAARTATRTLGELTITAGALLLLFVIWQLWWTDLGAGRAEAATRASLTQSWEPAAASPSASPSTPPPAAPPDGGAAADPPVLPEPAHGEAFAVVHVPRFGAGWQVAAAQGVTTRDVLDDGVLGHYPGTAMPGAVGDFAVAGHRTTYGAPLNRIDELAGGDPLVVEVAAGWYVYRVTGHEVVTPDRVDVIAPVPGAPGAVPVDRVMTLTACHPEFSARYRYVVHATMERWVPRAAGAPGELAAGG